MKKTKLLILLTVFIDILGMGIVIPILPFYVESFGASAFIVTALFAVYALCSFLSAPIIGALSDRFGRRPMLIISIFSTAAGWIIFALAPSIPMLFLGRIIDGIAAGNLPIAQAYLTDIARNDKERSTNLGLIGAIFGIAFIVGPFVGGVLGAVSHTFPFWFVGGLALINALLALIMLPETHLNRHHKKISINPFTPLIRASRDKILLPNYIAWFLCMFAIAGFQSIFALYVGAVFNIGEFGAGMIFAGMGVIIALNQGFFLKQIWLKYFNETHLEWGMLLMFAIATALAGIPNILIFFIALIGTTLGQSTLRAVMTSQIVAQAGQTMRGEVLGITSSITSMSMALAPLVAGILFGIQVSFPFITGGMLLAIAFIILYTKYRRGQLSGASTTILST